MNDIPMPLPGPAPLSPFIAGAPLPVACIDSQCRVVESNALMRALCEKKNDELAGWAFDTLFGDESRAQLHALIARLMIDDSAPATLNSAELSLPGGATPIVSLFLSRLPHLEPEPQHEPLILIYAIDITEQKNLEMRFAHSQKMQAVGQLAGGVAHDFNNLLTAMIGFCDLLLMRHPAGDPSFADIMQVKQNANRAANLVRQLLAFSRRQTLQPKVIDITDVLAELSNLVRRLIGENIELKVVHGRDLGMVRADQGQLEQVFINLAVNARDAMKGGGMLTLRTSNVTIDSNHRLPRDFIPPVPDDVIAEGDYVLVEVSDSGHGIPRPLIQKIFEPFFSTKEVGSGTGLGLSTVYGIIKQTGGTLYVRSEPDAGTSFYLYFPRYSGNEQTSSAAEAEATERSGNSDLTGKGTILLVEDETPVRIFAGRALRNKGYTVIEADSGETGLEAMEKENGAVDVIVTDVIMPGMNGPAMIEKISEKYPNVKVIFMSGYAEDAFSGSFGEEREFHFLPKPFTLKQLAGKVKEVREE